VGHGEEFLLDSGGFYQERFNVSNAKMGRARRLTRTGSPHRPAEAQTSVEHARPFGRSRYASRQFGRRIAASLVDLPLFQTFRSGQVHSFETGQEEEGVSEIQRTFELGATKIGPRQ